MRVIIVFVAMLALCSCGSKFEESYPSDWPTCNDLSINCNEIAGVYVDPNIQVKLVDPKNNITNGSKWVRAGFTFAFEYEKMRYKDSTVKSRTVSVSFDADKSIVLNYRIDGVSVVLKKISKNDYTCDKNGLNFIVYSRTGEQVYDMFPNQGTIIKTLTIYRIKNYLYVKDSIKTKAVFFGFIPRSSLHVNWQRFSTE